MRNQESQPAERARNNPVKTQLYEDVVTLHGRPMRSTTILLARTRAPGFEFREKEERRQIGGPHALDHGIQAGLPGIHQHDTPTPAGTGEGKPTGNTGGINTRGNSQHTAAENPGTGGTPQDGTRYPTS